MVETQAMLKMFKYTKYSDVCSLEEQFIMFNNNNYTFIVITLYIYRLQTSHYFRKLINIGPNKM